MALQNTGGILYVPEQPIGLTGIPSFGSVTVDADNEGIGMVFQAPRTGTITGFGLPTGATVTSGDAGTVWALRNVDFTSTPAIPGGTTHASGTVNPSAATTWYDVSGFSYNATQGEYLAVTVTRPSSGSLNATFRTFADENGSNNIHLPYLVVNVGAGWVAGQNAVPCIAVNYGGTYYSIRGSWPMQTLTTTAFNNTSTPDVRGNVWIPRFNCRVCGLWAWMLLDGGAVFKFYDTDGATVLASASLTANGRSSVNAGVVYVPFDDALGAANITPTVGSTYRIGIEPSSGTNLTVYDFTCGGNTPSAAYMDAFGFGQNMYLTTAKDPDEVGDWSNDTTRRLFMGLVVDQLDDGVQAQQVFVAG